MRNLQIYSKFFLGSNNRFVENIFTALNVTFLNNEHNHTRSEKIIAHANLVMHKFGYSAQDALLNEFNLTDFVDAKQIDQACNCFSQTYHI